MQFAGRSVRAAWMPLNAVFVRVWDVAKGAFAGRKCWKYWLVSCTAALRTSIRILPVHIW